ncbi:hypothetical protein [Altibacter sp. HG106]|uniref:hypothetical protein n=1 Tax=Altibacter sp. HG106 TaxID=3023937 RepID=UPI002350C2AD|nr:hypothetical protein [Altibacter sp. HG106]MDC7994457.1 hypothetical protein [Altibacter sp. HG106]
MEQVIKTLVSVMDDKKRFNELLRHFMSHKYRPESQARFYNKAGFSKDRLKQLEYDVKKLYGIKDVDLKDDTVVKNLNEQSAPDQKGASQNADPHAVLMEIAAEKATHDDLIDAAIYLGLPKPDLVKTPEFSKGIAGNRERKEWLKSNGQEEVPKTNVELDEAISEVIVNINEEQLQEVREALVEYQSKAVNGKEVEFTVIGEGIEIPEEAGTGLKLRSEFPFLEEEDCPDELKVLVADKLTAWKKFLEGREELKEKVDSLSSAEIYELAEKTVKNFELNQEIYDELNYYKENKKVLGQHPIFADMMLEKKVVAYKPRELATRFSNLKNYIRRDSKKLDESKETEAQEKLQAKIDEWKAELDLVKKRLSADEEE